MTLTALIDLVNSGACTLAGIYAVIVILHVFSARHTPLLPAVIVSMGVIGWATFFTLSLMTVVDLPLDIDVTWHINQGFTFGRVLLASAWVHYLIKLKG